MASTGLFALYKVPLSQALTWTGGGSTDGLLLLVLYEALGAYLAFLYQRSGGSLPFVCVAHATCNGIVTALRAAQAGSVLPF